MLTLLDKGDYKFTLSNSAEETLRIKHYGAQLVMPRDFMDQHRPVLARKATPLLWADTLMVIHKVTACGLLLRTLE